MPRAPRDQPGPSTTTPNGDGPKTGDKRRWTPAMYERRRAASACQTCRMRKTKCDNQRPICGFCQQSRGRCVYTDKAATDHSSLVSCSPRTFVTSQDADMRMAFGGLVLILQVLLSWNESTTLCPYWNPVYTPQLLLNMRPSPLHQPRFLLSTPQRLLKSEFTLSTTM
jgi:hypothetical protein